MNNLKNLPLSVKDRTIQVCMWALRQISIETFVNLDTGKSRKKSVGIDRAV